MEPPALGRNVDTAESVDAFRLSGLVQTFVPTLFVRDNDEMDVSVLHNGTRTVLSPARVARPHIPSGNFRHDATVRTLLSAVWSHVRCVHAYPDYIETILVFAGDIFYLKNKVAPLANFRKWISANYREVFTVPGNHEYYNYCDVMDNGLQWNWIFKKNVGYYQNQVMQIDDTDFIISTLWSRISPSDEHFVWKSMNEIQQIMYNGNYSRQRNSIRCTVSVWISSGKV